MIFGMLLAPQQKMKIKSVYQVALQSSLPPISYTPKWHQFYETEEAFETRLKKDQRNKENQIMRIIVNQWDYVQYYVDWTLNYCKNANILSQLEIETLRTTRLEKLADQRGGSLN